MTDTNTNGALDKLAKQFSRRMFLKYSMLAHSLWMQTLRVMILVQQMQQ